MPPKRKSRSVKYVEVAPVAAPQVHSAPVQQAGASAEGDFKTDHRAAGLPEAQSAMPDVQMLSFLKLMGDARKNEANLSEGEKAIQNEILDVWKMGQEAYARDPTIKFRLGTNTAGAIMALGKRGVAAEAERYMDDLLKPSIDKRVGKLKTMHRPAALNASSGPATATSSGYRSS